MRDSTRDDAIASLYPALTMRQIGVRFGVSGERVRQILARQGIRGQSHFAPIAERFWPKVQKGEGCWEWQGSRYPTGYGHILEKRRADGKWTYGNAHRVSWELHNGPIPDGMYVLHRCDNPPCVRPDHLWLGTPLDNTQDRDAKGRGRGGANAPSKLRRRVQDLSKSA